MSAHTGTHMDAPLHFLADGAGLDRLPLGNSSVVCCPCDPRR